MYTKISAMFSLFTFLTPCHPLGVFRDIKQFITFLFQWTLSREGNVLQFLVIQFRMLCYIFIPTSQQTCEHGKFPVHMY